VITRSRAIGPPTTPACLAIRTATVDDRGKRAVRLSSSPAGWRCPRSSRHSRSRARSPSWPESSGAALRHQGRALSAIHALPCSPPRV
jgi:hypothetical protein